MHNIGLHTQSFRSQLSSETKGKHQADAKGTHPPLHLTSVVRRRSEESGELGAAWRTLHGTGRSRSRRLAGAADAGAWTAASSGGGIREIR